MEHLVYVSEIKDHLPVKITIAQIFFRKIPAEINYVMFTQNGSAYTNFAKSVSRKHLQWKVGYSISVAVSCAFSDTVNAGYCE